MSETPKLDEIYTAGHASDYPNAPASQPSEPPHAAILAEWDLLSIDSRAKVQKWFDLATKYLQAILDVPAVPSQADGTLRELWDAVVKLRLEKCPHPTSGPNKIGCDRCIVETISQRIQSELSPLREAAKKIHHWHDWGTNNEGMVVSADAVRELWAALDRMG